MFNFWVVSYESHGRVYDIRQIGAETRKAALLLATRRARMLVRDARRMNIEASAKVFAVNEEDLTIVENGPVLYEI